MSRTERTKLQLIESNIFGSENPMLDSIVVEVEHALFPPVHEQKTPTFGCLIREDKFASSKGVLIPTVSINEPLVRELSDGVFSFARKNSSGIESVVTFSSPHHDERQLIQLAQDNEAFLVHRDSNERTRILTQKSIFIFQNGEWIERPYASSVASVIKKAVPQVDPDLLDSVLEFAFHVLSPVNVGATLIVWLSDESIEEQPHAVLVEAEIDLQQACHYQPLRALLSVHDGATYVSKNGIVKSIENHLQYSEKSQEVIKQVGGTRHTSARRFSFDKFNALAIVVSEDGPVSVFSDGVKVTELHQFRVGQTASSLRSLAPAKADDVVTDAFLVTCENCGKRIDVEVVTVYGLRDRETGACPVCDHVVHSKNCWQINTKLVKRPPSATDFDVAFDL